MDFQRGLTEKAKLERKRPAVLAASVFDPPPPRSGEPGVFESSVKSFSKFLSKSFLKESQEGLAPVARGTGSHHG